MDDSAGLARAVAFGVAGYPLYLARTLIQIGYEPTEPDQYGNLPNMFSYIRIIRVQRGYYSLYTGLRYYLPAVVLKKTAYDLMASATNHKKEIDPKCDASELIALCMRESALRIHTTLLTYPLVTLGIGYISAYFFGKEKATEYTVATLYRGIIPKLIVEVIMVWVTNVSQRLTVYLTDDTVVQAIASRVPPFIVQSFLYPFNVVSTVMAEGGQSRMNPSFDDWRKCFHYLSANGQHKRGSSFFYRRDYQRIAGTKISIMRYF